MWWTTISNAKSCGPSAYSVTRSGGSCSRSNPVATSADTAASSSSEATDTTASSAPDGSTTWCGSPAISSKTVRRLSCRVVTSRTACRSAGTSSTPVSRTKNGMLYAGPWSASRFRNHSRCCANDNGSRSGRSPATSGRRARCPEPTCSASRATVGASKTIRSGISTSSTAEIRLISLAARND
ncbi:hypothetical protein Lesp02_17090 [Lentzea sp. NBRC 105346]|nr:hypothetical protein Lesp02_17090 [Lentzea sp. NBRC 105346]